MPLSGWLKALMRKHYETGMKMAQREVKNGKARKCVRWHARS